MSFSRRRFLLPYLPSPILSSPFSSLDGQSDTPNNEYRTRNQCVIDERSVLDELADLLPVLRGTPASDLHKRGNSEKRVEITRAADGFLLPEEKLRGVFLQNLRGKTAIEQALTDVDVELNVEVVGKVVNRGNLDDKKMVMFFNWAIRQPTISKDIDTYHIILKALGRRKFLNCMVEVLHQLRIEGVNPNLETLEIVMDSLVRARQVSKAIRTFRNLDELGLDCDTESLNVLLECLCRRSHVGAANSLLHSMKGKIPFNGATYNIVMSGWCRFGRVGEMERILEMMVGDGIDPDGSTVSNLIEGLGRAGRIDDAVKIFEDMKEKNGWVPDSSVYNAMISNYIAVGDCDECVKYYNSMLSSACEPSIDTYTKLIGAFLKVRRVADALELFDEMLDRGVVPSTGTVTSFIEPLCSYGPPHAAMMVYKKAKKVGCRISLSAYKLLLIRLSRFGKCGMLLNIWNEMQECSYSSDVEVYEYVINGLCNIGQLENAVLVMEECLRKGFCPSRLICSKLNNKLLALNKVEIAYKLFLKLKDARLEDNARRYWRAKGWHF
ncbi:putative pentatricopeptide repeat-containing protein At5g43820 [Morus notabilis]|uniref:putative pentatricopeptide repeat-containing protein At5g43820 n=1 Tax=Morus notabilis TaxID=981085 RepID=UPI000CED5135|nr:putative pentatricopeptide repeat-containing protein At5g43820 [Morus notabilis]